MNSYHAIGFVVLGSLFLVLLFYFFKYLEDLLMVCVLVSATSSCSLMINEYITFFFNRSEICLKEYNIKYIGKISISYFFSFLLALILTLSYAFTKNYMLSNLIALFMVLIIFRLLRIYNLKTASTLLIAAFFYDIYWVFFSSRIFGNSVMASVATKVDLPMKFVCPVFKNSPVPHCSMIGLGDLVLPGIFVAFCYRLDKSLGNSNYFAVCWTGYALGLSVCMIFLMVYHSA